VIAAALDAASAALCWGTKLCGLAFSSAMHSLVGVDADDQSITPLVTWRIAGPPSRPSACAPRTRSCMRGLQPPSVRSRRWRSSSGFARPSRGALLRRQRNGASGGSRSAIVSAHPRPEPPVRGGAWVKDHGSRETPELARCFWCPGTATCGPVSCGTSPFSLSRPRARVTRDAAQNTTGRPTTSRHPGFRGARTVARPSCRVNTLRYDTELRKR
jgi:hypothetical protein